MVGYITQKVEYYCSQGSKLKNKKRVIWACPFYQRWFAMLTRYYKKSELERHPTYLNKTVCTEWLKFSNFKAWMEKQDWEGKDLDKDILVQGNTEYHPDKCVFIPQWLNKFLLEKTKDRGLPTGVCFHKKKNKFIAASGGRQIGTFDTVKSAEIAWCSDKLKQAIEHSKTVSDQRVADAIVIRYTEKLNNAMKKESYND